MTSRVIDNRTCPSATDVVRWGDWADWAKDRYKTPSITVEIFDDKVTVDGLYDGDPVVAHAERMKDPNFRAIYEMISIVEAQRGGSPVQKDWLQEAVDVEAKTRKPKRR